MNDLGIVTGQDGYIPLENVCRVGRKRRAKSLLSCHVHANLTQEEHDEIVRICHRDDTTISEVLRKSWLIAREQLL